MVVVHVCLCAGVFASIDILLNNIMLSGELESFYYAEAPSSSFVQAFCVPLQPWHLRGDAESSDHRGCEVRHLDPQKGGRQSGLSRSRSFSRCWRIPYPQHLADWKERVTLLLVAQMQVAANLLFSELNRLDTCHPRESS